MTLRRNSSSLITASLIVYQILCNFKANTTELAVNFAWHSAADAFILSTLLLHPSANITPAAAHLEPILPRGSIYGSYRAIHHRYRSLATDAAFAATGKVPDATTACLPLMQLPQLSQLLLPASYQMQPPPACLQCSFFSCRNGCYQRAIRRSYSHSPATSKPPVATAAARLSPVQLSHLLPATHQTQLRPLACYHLSFPLCYRHPPDATAAARMPSSQLSHLLPVPTRRNCGRSLMLCRLHLGHD